MKKITNFIVDHRNFVFIIFLIFTVISLFLSNNVKVNRDILKYLPKDSLVHQGMDIMDNEFSSLNSSNLNIMFKDLTNAEKTNIYNELCNIDGIKEVEYDNSSNYNKDQYTLYIIEVDDDKDSKLATQVYQEITDKYADYQFYTSSDVSDENKVILPVWIPILAIASALVILIIMCESYLEPFLFLTAIGLGVFLNNGTNIIFPSISSITSSISAILQLALSMDYSIMLMNRYREEKINEPDNNKAMKKALTKSFASISSSSVTTIVGLLALVFMSFTIGKDLGLVLAKGVMFSLLTIFTCLPFLILTFDKLITKTTKKTPIIKLDFLGKFNFRFRYLGCLIFIIVFIGSIFLKGNLKILYTDSDSDEIRKIFPTNNQIALIYPNNAEALITETCASLKNDSKVTDVLCYSNTINEKLPVESLNAKLNELGSSVEIPEYLLKIIYYNYFNPDAQDKLTFNEFINFIKKDVYNNKELQDTIDKEMRDNIDKLANFTTSQLMTKGRSVKEIANMFLLDTKTVNDLMIYYNSLNNQTALTLTEFTKFMNDYFLKSSYAQSIDQNSLSSFNKLAKFTDSELISREMTAQELANTLNIDEKLIYNLFVYYQNLYGTYPNLTLNEFFTFIINNVFTDANYSSNFDEATKNKIILLQKFSDIQFINQDLTVSEMSSIFNINPELIKQIYLLKYLDEESDIKITIKEFVEGLTYLKNNTDYLKDVDISSLKNIPDFLLNSSTTYTYNQLAQILNIDESLTNKVYNLISYTNNNTNSWVITPYQFISIILYNDEILANLNSESLNNFKLLYQVMDSSLKETTYNPETLTTLLNIPLDTLKNIFSLYTLNQTNPTMSLANLVNFVLTNKDIDIIKNNLNDSLINELRTLQSVMNSVLSKTEYSSSSLAKFLNLPLEQVNLLYALYDIEYSQNTPNISYQSFVKFLINDIIPNSKYNANFTEDKIIKINTINGIMTSSLNNTKYTKEEIFAILKKLSNEVESNLIDLLYIYYGSSNTYQKEWQLTVEEFVNFLNDSIITDAKYNDFIDNSMRQEIIDAQTTINDSKSLLVGKSYSRVVLNTKYDLESQETFNFLTNLKNKLNSDIYLVGNSAMAYEMNDTFQQELNFITILTALFIFIIVAITFKSLLIPTILVILIQTSVYITMGILSVQSGSVYFIAILIVQSILMGATIDYAILFTSYYKEERMQYDIKNSLINAYNKSIHTILTSSLVLTLVTLIIGHLGTATTAKICITISEGTICSTILILGILPTIIASVDKFIIKKVKD